VLILLSQEYQYSPFCRSEVRAPLLAELVIDVEF